MPTLLRVLILVPLGFVLAVAAAGLTITIGLVGADRGAAAVGPLIVLTTWTAMFVGAYSFLPWLVAVVIAEGFGLRSLFFWFAVGGGIGGASYVFTDFVGDITEGGFMVAVHLAAGFVGGFVYWLIVGRLSGDGFVRPE